MPTSTVPHALFGRMSPRTYSPLPNSTALRRPIAPANSYRANPGENGRNPMTRRDQKIARAHGRLCSPWTFGHAFLRSFRFPGGISSSPLAGPSTAAPPSRCCLAWPAAIERRPAPCRIWTELAKPRSSSLPSHHVDTKRLLWQRHNCSQEAACNP